jgi:NAD(P)-dependent dehydrogenase (short-subunit alcohol dehydrogenase family)
MLKLTGERGPPRRPILAARARNAALQHTFTWTTESEPKPRTGPDLNLRPAPHSMDAGLGSPRFGACPLPIENPFAYHGVLIQNASIVGRTAKPDSTAYATSKFAVRGFSEALRQEVLDQPDIQVCTILPSVIDTPFFEHAANFSRHQVRAAPPVYTAEKVAETVVGLVERPRAEVVIGGFGKLASFLKPLTPWLGTRLTGRALNYGFLAGEPSSETAGALFAPMRDGRAVSGGWRYGPNNGGVPTLAALALLVLPLGMLAWRRRRQRAA